jgi:DNA primase
MDFKKMNAEAEQIKDRVTVPEALSMYGIRVDGRRRIPCPVHGGRNRNFSYNERAFYCFKCGARGDVIELVKSLFNIRFPDAIAMLGRDFGIRSVNKLDPRIREQAAIEARFRREAAQEYQRRWKEYLQLCKLHAVLFRQLYLHPDIEGLSKYVNELDRKLDAYVLLLERR